MTEPYDWQMSTLGEWDEWEDEMREADLGWVGWVFLAGIVVVTVVGLWVL